MSYFISFWYSDDLILYFDRFITLALLTAISKCKLIPFIVDKSVLTKLLYILNLYHFKENITEYIFF